VLFSSNGATYNKKGIKFAKDKANEEEQQNRVMGLENQKWKILIHNQIIRDTRVRKGGEVSKRECERVNKKVRK
jgi:hypothetical protein